MRTRPALNAGVFYPAEKASILAAIAHYRHQALTCPDNIPKAIVAPHAGWQYCGPVMASAFAGVTAKTIKKIVHLGPSHQYPITGVVESRVSAFETPLGKCPVTPVSHPLVTGDFEPHRSEYSLEVQLPFMQALLGSFDYIPLLVGECAPKAIAALLNSH